MLSNHEFVVAVRELWEEVQAIEAKINTLFKQQFVGVPHGPTGVTGTDEAAYTIQYLRAAANQLEAIYKEQVIGVLRLEVK